MCVPEASRRRLLARHRAIDTPSVAIARCIHPTASRPFQAIRYVATHPRNLQPEGDGLTEADFAEPVVPDYSDTWWGKICWLVHAGMLFPELRLRVSPLAL